jgi:hypothetical protein
LFYRGEKLRQITLKSTTNSSNNNRLAMGKAIAGRKYSKSILSSIKISYHKKVNTYECIVCILKFVEENIKIFLDFY